MSFEFGRNNIYKKEEKSTSNENGPSVNEIRAAIDSLEEKARQGKKVSDSEVTDLEATLRIQEAKEKIPVVRAKITELEGAAKKDSKRKPELLAAEDEIRRLEIIAAGGHQANNAIDTHKEEVRTPEVTADPEGYRNEGTNLVRVDDVEQIEGRLVTKKLGQDLATIDAAEVKEADEDHERDTTRLLTAEERKQIEYHPVKGGTIDPALYTTDPADPTSKEPKRIFHLGVIDADALLEAQAKDLADSRMTESAEDRSGNFFKRTAKKIWKHNLAQEYYRQKEIARARKDIRESQNLYAGENGGEDRAAHIAAMGAVAERFTTGMDEEMLREGEEAIHDPVLLDKQIGARAEIKNLIKEYAGGTMDDASFIEARQRALSRLGENYVDTTKLYADNLLNIAKEVKKAVAEGRMADDAEFDIRLTLGTARESLRSEANMNAFDRIIEKVQNSKVGKIVLNQGTILALAAGYSAVNAATTSAVRSKAGTMLTFGGTAVASGVIGAVKESARVSRERNQHMRERAKGKTFEGENMDRRDEMEENRYNTQPASAYIADLHQGLDIAKNQDSGSEQLGVAVSRLIDVESRIKLGDMHKADLISYSGFDSVEIERTNLDLLRAQLKVALKAKGINEDRFNEEIQTRIKSLKEGEGGVDAKDVVFGKLKRRKVVAAFFKSTVVAGAFGLGMSEIAAEVQAGFDPNLDGAASGISNYVTGNENIAAHATPLESMIRYVAGSEPRMPMGTAHEIVAAGSHIRVPEGANVVQGENGASLIMKDGTSINLAIGNDGGLTEATKESLSKIGVHSSIDTITVQQPQVIPIDAKDYIVHHPTSTVHRELFYDNNTPHPFDKNELREWWGGKGGTGIDEHGNYVLSMQHMKPDGSYHGGANADAQELLKNGKLKMMFSISEGTQAHPFILDIDKDGNVLIPKDSEVARLMFTQVQGNGMFTGKFAEVAEVVGKNPDGTEVVRILSTVTGNGHDVVSEIRPTMTAPLITLDLPQDWDTLIYPIVPPPPRRALEAEETEGETTTA